jgi:glycosyltransferase involved in cell wall biosynthesis
MVMDHPEKSRLLFVSYTSVLTGPSNSLLLLLDGLRAQYDVGVLMPEPGPLADQLTERGIPWQSVGPITKWRLLRLIRAVQIADPDIVYANTTHGSSRLAFVVARLTGRRFVVHVRAMLWNKGWSSLWYLRLSDAVIAVSKATAKSADRFVPANRLFVVYNGVDVSDASTSAREGPKSAPSGRMAVVSVAHVCSRKGQLDAVSGLGKLVANGIDANLYLAGSLDREPSYVREVETLVSELGLGDRVFLLGYEPNVRDLLRRADAFVHTAYDDPHPRAVIEAMSEGLPVVAYATDGVSETVVEGRTGFLVPQNDVVGLAARLGRVLTDAQLRDRLGKTGAALANSEFTSLATANGVRQVIRSVLAKR